MLYLKDIFPKKVINSYEKTEHLRYRLVQLFVMVLPFDLLYSNIVLYLIIATTLFDLNFRKLKEIPKQVWIFQLVYFLAVIGYFYSFNKGAAGFLMERQLTIFMLPLLLPLAFRMTEIRKKELLHVFTISLVLTICYLMVMALVTVKTLGLPLKSIVSKEFFNHQFSAPIGIHAGYLSLYTSLCVLHISHLLMEKPSVLLKSFLVVCLLILLIGLFFLASRNIIIATFLIFAFVFPWFFIKRKFIFFSFLFVFIISSYFVVSHIAYLSDRFSSDLITDIKLTDGSQYNFSGAEPRIKRWECAFELIKQSPITGYGTGDEISMLKSQYIKNGLYISYLESFNAHNQYLSYAIKNGIIGLIIFLGTFTYYVWLSLRNRSYIYFSFLLLLLIGFFTENILDANKGIFFFAFFNTIFGYTLLNNQKKNIE